MTCCSGGGRANSRPLPTTMRAVRQRAARFTVPASHASVSPAPAAPPATALRNPFRGRGGGRRSSPGVKRQQARRGSPRARRTRRHPRPLQRGDLVYPLSPGEDEGRAIARVIGCAAPVTRVRRGTSHWLLAGCRVERVAQPVPTLQPARTGFNPEGSRSPSVHNPVMPEHTLARPRRRNLSAGRRVFDASE
jgi:hypothetical protein